jgi:hypothetical protein
MKLSTILAGTVIAGLAFFGTAGTAFASTTNPYPGPTSTWGPGNDNSNGHDGNGHGDGNGCQQDHGGKGHDGNNDQNWNDGRGGDKGGNCDGDHCTSGRGLLSWNCGDGDHCHFPVLSGWNQWENSWLFGNDCNGHHAFCTWRLTTFYFPHGSHILTELSGPILRTGELALYNGVTYTIFNVWGHYFTVTDASHHLVTNHGRSIWNGVAYVQVCTR